MKGYKHSTQEQRSQILELFQQGKPTTEICRIVGVTADMVRGELKRNNLKPTGRKDSACSLNADILREMARDGASLAQMSARVGTNRTRLRDYLTRNGIEYVRHGQSYPGESNPSWRGGVMIENHNRDCKKKYVLIHNPSHPYASSHGYVREHRLVMESMIGRYLAPEEVVHHKNGNTLDNNPDNLELFASNGEHLHHELSGRVPNWSEDGKQKILESVSRPRSKKPEPTRRQTVTDDLL